MESSNGMGEGQGEVASQPLVNQGAHGSDTAPKVDERTFRQSEVNDIVKRAKYGAVEDYKRIVTEQPSYAQSKYGNPSDYQPSQTQHSANTLNDDQVRKIAAEEGKRYYEKMVQDERSKLENQQAQSIVKNFWDKLKPGYDKYPNLEKDIRDNRVDLYPDVVGMVSTSVDNAADVMHHFTQNPEKMAEIQKWAEDGRYQHIAYQKLQRLAQSIKENAQAESYKSPREPLNQMRPSNTGTDTGAMSVSDYRKKYRV